MKKMKRLIGIMISTIMLMSSCLSYASPVDFSTEESNLLSKEDAKLIAESLVASDIPNMNWNKDTAISNIIEMYDQNGMLNSYSFEFKKGEEYNGYAIVSAYKDSSEVILEYSDDMKPIYDEMNLKENEEVVYLGNLNYYKDDGSENLRTVDNQLVNKREVKNDLFNLRSEKNLGKNEQFINNLKKNMDDIEILDYKGLVDNNIIKTTSYIENPYDHANSNFVGPFVLHSYRNDFENYIPYRVQSGRSCVPNSITNLIVAIGKFHNWNTIVNKSTSQVYNTVVNIKKQGTIPYYNNGTSTEDIPSYMKKSFAAFNFNINTVRYTNANFNNIKSQIDAYRPFLLWLYKEQNYGNSSAHALAAFAYNRLQSQTTGYLASYLKVVDGYEGKGRYLNIGSLQNTSTSNARIYPINY